MEGSENKDGGGRGIRTPDDREAITDFKSAGFNHSPIPPEGRIILDWFSARSQAISLFSCSGCKVCRKTWMVFFNIVSGSKRVSASSLAPSES